MESIIATLLSIRYRNPERSWLVAQLRMDKTKETFIATGDIPYSETEEEVQLYGEWIEDKKYGKQFKVSSSHRVLPKDISGLEKYLAYSEDIKGIGPVRASKLATYFRDNLFTVLDEKPNELSECPGISDELAKKIAVSWKHDTTIRKLSLYLAQHGVSPHWARRILKNWDVGTAIERIDKNPYSLTEIEGIGFITADEIALSLGGKKDSPERMTAACVYVVSQAVNNGNVFLHENQLIDEIVKLVSPRGKDTSKVREQAIQAVTKAVEDKKLICQTISDGISTLRLLYLPYLYKAEKELAERIAELNEYAHDTPKHLERVLQEVQEESKIRFSPKQLDAIKGAFSNRTVVITGGPGTGKTTIATSICKIAGKISKIILCVAPTGRAAKRLSEITGRTASTIHRVLKWRDDGPSFNRGNQLEVDVLIIDESSMLDLDLANKLLQAIPNNCSVIFIGDVDQLPAVGAGTTLRDIMESKTISVYTLDMVFRQAEASLIIRNSHLIKRGEVPRFPQDKTVKENSYVMWIPPNPKDEGGRDDADYVKEKLSRLVSINIPEKYKVNPIKDIQVLVPMKKNTLGTHELNKVLQKAINPNGREFTAGGKLFRVGDRVMQTRNNYDEGMDIYNGDVGFIISDQPEEKCVDVDFYGRTVSISYEELGDLQLAYAQTIHKAQGSEYPIVIIVMAYQHWPMLERNLIYTANTRAKDLCLFLASKGAIEQAVKNNPVKERNTYLAQRLRACMSGDKDVR